MATDELEAAISRMRSWASVNLHCFRMDPLCITDEQFRQLAISCLGDEIVVALTVPDATLADYAAAKGAMFDAAAGWVDWERMHEHEPDSIAPPGRIILQILDRLPS